MSKAIDDMTVAELKVELRDLGEKVSGKKAELVSRLKKAKRGKSPKSSPRKSPRKVPKKKATEEDVGSVKSGMDGNKYQVIKNKGGKNQWVKCSSEKASCSPSATKASLKKDLEKMTVAQLKKKLTKDELDVLGDRAKTLRGRRSPLKKELVAAVLKKEGKVSPKKVSERRPTSPKRRKKGKERVDKKPKPSPKRKVTPDKDVVGIELSGLTIVGELEEAYDFLRISGKADLMSKIEVKKAENPPAKYRGIYRLESDASCKKNCGAQVFGVEMEAGEYPIDAVFKSKSLNAVYVGGGKPKGAFRGDLSFLQHFVVADLDAMYNFIRGVNSFDELLAKERPSTIQIFSNPPRKTPYLMNFKLPGKDGVYTGIYASRA